MKEKSHFNRKVTLIMCLLLVASTTVYAQSGHVLNGVGPLDQSWSGAGMANPQDGITALHWNPAAITTIDATTLDISLQLMAPTTDLSSSILEGSFGTGNPSTTLSGKTSSSAGPFPIPAAGFVLRPRESRWAFGISAFGVGGFGVDYEASNPVAAGSNPIAYPQSTGGFGAINSSFALFQVAPTVAYKLTDKLSIGVSPTVNVGMLEVNPFPAAAPDQSGYPAGNQTEAVGYGFQVGLHMQDVNDFNFGVSLKSTQYFNDYEFEDGTRKFAFGMDYPMILSAAVGYSGLDRFEFAVDVRYIDFENTDGFDSYGFDQFGAVTGFGWNSIVVAALGVQYEVTEKLPIRVGYSYNESPITDDMAFYNVASPAIVQHHISGGLTYRFTDKLGISAAVQYAPANDVGCPLQNPQLLESLGSTSVPGTFVKSELSTFTAIVGANVRF